MKKIAIFCGAFNPPLISHFSLAKQILDSDVNIERVIFVPVSAKYNKPDLIEDEHRYNMLKIECDKDIRLEISNIELNTEKQPYTIETLRNLKKQYKDYELYLIMGTDNLKTLDKWHLAECILKEFSVLALERDNDSVLDIIDSIPILKKYNNKIIELKNIVKINLSSTLIRNKLKAKKDMRYLIPQDVLEYIEKEKLYNT